MNHDLDISPLLGTLLLVIFRERMTAADSDAGFVHAFSSCKGDVL
jgi:hypothetical protein